MCPIINNMMEKKATIPTCVQPKLHIWDYTKLKIQITCQTDNLKYYGPMKSDGATISYNFQQKKGHIPSCPPD